MSTQSNAPSQSETPPVLEVGELEAGYWDFPVLKGVHLTVRPGAFVSVIGPNGSGKSTLLKAVYGLIKVTGGQISFVSGGGGVELRGRSPHEITRLGLNYLPQLDSIFPDMSVRENLEIGATPLSGAFSAHMDRVLTWFPQLTQGLTKRAGTLSGGQQRMVALARALITEPTLLLLDEPSAGLAPVLVDDLFERIAAVHASGVAILMVEQNARRALALSDYAYVLELGRNRLEGPGASLIDDPQVVELYLGAIGGYQELRTAAPPPPPRPSAGAAT